MSHLDNDNSIPHHQMLSSDPNTKAEDETQKDFRHNHKKLLISSARIIDKINTDTMVEIKLPQKTQENQEDVGVVQTNIDASMARDDKVMQAEQNEYYIFFNRFLYSQKCIIIYVIIIVIDIVGMANLIASYAVKNISNYKYINI